MSIIRAQPVPRAVVTRPPPEVGRTPEVIVVTHDAELERALREAAPSTPILIASTPAALADLLMAGRAGALVLDLKALESAALTVARHLAEQFPDVPLVAVGSREDEARLAGLISRGLVYRFLHQPVSAARARTFIEAALRRSAEVGPVARSSAAPPAAAASGRSHPMLALAAAGAIAALVLGFWLALRPPASGHAPAPPLATSPASDRPAAPSPAALAGAPAAAPPMAPAPVPAAAPTPTPAAEPARPALPRESPRAPPADATAAPQPPPSPQAAVAAPADEIVGRAREPAAGATEGAAAVKPDAESLPPHDADSAPPSAEPRPAAGTPPDAG